MKWLLIILLVLTAVRAEAQTPTATGTTTPTATPTSTGPAMCSVTGTVVDAGGNPFVNGTITFNSLRIQVINGVAVNPTVVSTNTDPQGNIRAVSMPQGLAMQVTICPGTQQTSNCSAPFSVIIPFSQTANFGNLAQGVALTGSSTLNVGTLNVTGSSTLASTTINSNPFTVGSTTQQPDLTAGGTNTGMGPTQITSFVGIGTKGPQIQLITPTSPPPTETAIGSILWGSPANPNGTVVGGSSIGQVVAGINATTGGANAPSGGLQFSTALGDGTTAQTRMEVSRDGSIFVPTYSQAGSVFTGPGTINVSKGYYINGLATFNTNGLVLPNTSSTSIYWGSATTPTATMVSLGGMNLTAGMHFNSVGAQWIADTTTAQTFAIGNGALDFYMNTGLTVGSAFTPTDILHVSAGGLYLQGNGHLASSLSGKPAPTVSACGTGGSIGGGSTDFAGFITAGSSAGGCQITFGRSYTGGLICVATPINQNVTVWILNPSVNGFTIGCGSGAAGQCANGGSIYYMCVGINGT